MAQQITINQNKGSRGSGVLVIRADGTGYLNLNGGTNPANAASEVITEMWIAEATWSCNTGSRWALARGSNTVFTLHAPGGHINFSDQNRLEASGAQSTSNLVFTLSNGPGNLILKMHKRSAE